MIKPPRSKEAKFIGSLLQKVNRRFDFDPSQFGGKTKSDGIEQVTGLDLALEQFIVSQIKKTFPGEAIVSEETLTLKPPETFWIVDPLDGTHNFLLGFRDFAVMLAFCSRGEIVTSGILLPAWKERWVAEKGRGAWLNNEAFTRPKLSQGHCLFGKSDLRRTGAGYPELLKKLNQVGFNIRLNGCAGRIFTFLVQMRGVILFDKAPNPWDVIPGILILQESGGRVLNIKGGQWTFQSKSLLVTHQLQKPMQKKLQKALQNFDSAPYPFSEKVLKNRSSG